MAIDAYKGGGGLLGGGTGITHPLSTAGGKVVAGLLTGGASGAAMGAVAGSKAGGLASLYSQGQQVAGGGATTPTYGDQMMAALNRRFNAPVQPSYSLGVNTSLGG